MNHSCRIRGLLIDMDGTLVDHSETLARCFQHACIELGYPPPSRETVQRSIGGSMPVTIRKFLPEKEAEAGEDLWRKHFEAIHLEGVELMPGAVELLKNCRDKGIKAAVFTNKTGRHTRSILENESISELFTFALGAEDSPYRKPEPPFSELAVEKMELQASEITLVGDSPFDIQAAKSVGMLSICVSTGSHLREELDAAGADLVFDDLHQVSRWISKSRSSSLA